MSSTGGPDGGPDEEERPCPDCECLPNQPAEGSDGDPSLPGGYFRSWVCTCACHEPIDDAVRSD